MSKTKLFALALALLMLLAASGCAGNDSGSKTGSPTTAAVTTSGLSETEKPAEVKKDPVTLKLMGWFSDTLMTTGECTDPVALYVKDKFNITLEVETTPESEYVNKLNLMMSTNDLPDIFGIGESAQFDKLLKADQILDLTSLIEQYGINLNSQPETQFMMDFEKAFYTNQKGSGKIYSLGMNMGVFDNPAKPLVSHYVRWDAYKAIGSPKIDSYEGMLDVLADMQEAVPQNKDGKKTYALGGWWGEGVGWGIDWCMMCQGGYPFGVLFTNDFITGLNIENYQYDSTNYLTNKDSIFWRVIKWWNKANQMGILDPDSFVQKYSDYCAKIEAGRYMYTYPNWVADKWNEASAAAGDLNSGYVVVPALNDKIAAINIKPSGERVFVVSKNCKAPDRAVMLLDWCSSYEGSFIILNGVEGKFWKMVDGKAAPTDEFIAAKKENSATLGDEMIKETGAGLYGRMAGLSEQSINPLTGERFGLDYYKAVMEVTGKPYEADAAKAYGLSNLIEVFDKVKFTTQNTLVLDAMPVMQDDLLAEQVSLQTYVFKEIPKLILPKNDAEFAQAQESFINGLSIFKMDEIMKFYLDERQKLSADIDPLLEKAKEIDSYR